MYLNELNFTDKIRNFIRRVNTLVTTKKDKIRKKKTKQKTDKSYIEPWVSKSFINGHSAPLLLHHKFLDEVLGILGYVFPNLILKVIITLCDVGKGI